MMRIRTALGLLICCCAALTACTAASHSGPVATVTPPSVGKPAPPASAQAGLSSEAFTAYAGLAAVPDDGLAPNDTYDALHTACMNDAGYGQYANDVPFFARENRGLTFASPYGPWGYLGTAVAAQEGFMAGSGPGGGGFAGPSPTSNVPAAAQMAGNKCFNILMNFNNAQFAGSMAGIEAMNNIISNDVFYNATIKAATKVWSACMARNGFSSPDPNTLALNELDTLGLRAIGPSGPPPAPTAAEKQAQIALAVADANCTQASDLAGIYFAVQASYEQQIVSANQQELNVEIRQFKAAFARELSRLPGLLRTASVKLNLPGPRGPRGPRGRVQGLPKKTRG
jgi:hypothetical protein